MGMAKNDRDGASARSDNRRMTGSVNIYICSEAFEKGKKNVETDNESAVINVTEKPKVTINPSNFGSNKVINRKIEQLTSNYAVVANNQEKLIMTTEFNESREEAKSRSNADEKHKISGIVSCRCPRYDESDLWLENAKNKRERRTVVVLENVDDKKNVEELKDLEKDDENLLPIEQVKKFSPSKHKSKVKLKKEKKKFKEAKKSKENNTWFSYFRRKVDSNAKDDVIFDDEDLCTCEKDFFKKKIKKENFKKQSKDKNDKKSTKKTRTTNVDGEAESIRKIRNDTNEKKISNKIKKASDAQKGNIELTSSKKHDRKKRPLSEEKSSNKKLLSKQNNENQKLPKSISSENLNNLSHKKSSLKRNEPETNVTRKKSVPTDRSFEKNTLSFDPDKKNDKTKPSAQRVKAKNKSYEKEDLATAQTSKLNNGSKDLENKENENETSFFAKFFSLFKSNREVPRKKSDKTRNRCDQDCTELKKTAKTSSSVRRKSKTKRRSHKSHLTGKIKEAKLTEKAFSSSNKSNIQVNEMHVDRKNQMSKKSRSRHANKMSNTEKPRKNMEFADSNEKYKVEEKSNLTEPMKGNLKKPDNEDNKPNSTPTDNPQNSKAFTNEGNSLRLCFSCLFPSGNCLCKRKLPEQQSCDCKKIVTFCCDELCKPSNDKKLHGSGVLPYQRSRNFPKVVNEMQGKMNENVKNNERCTCTIEECCDDKKPRAKCYYCKNLPCRCCVIGASRCTSKQ